MTAALTVKLKVDLMVASLVDVKVGQLVNLWGKLRAEKWVA